MAVMSAQEIAKVLKTVSDEEGFQHDAYKRLTHDAIANAFAAELEKRDQNFDFWAFLKAAGTHTPVGT